MIRTLRPFVAAVRLIVHTGARPVFTDVDPRTGNLDLEATHAALTARTKAIILALCVKGRARGRFFRSSSHAEPASVSSYI
jgi:hypothetical protein